MSARGDLMPAPNYDGGSNGCMALGRAREAFDAAQVCPERGLHSSATSRTSDAMFWAAQLAWARGGLGRSEWSHPAFQASFVNEPVSGRKLYPAPLGGHYNRAPRFRLDADHRPKGIGGAATGLITG